MRMGWTIGLVGALALAMAGCDDGTPSGVDAGGGGVCGIPPLPCCAGGVCIAGTCNTILDVCLP